MWCVMRDVLLVSVSDTADWSKLLKKTIDKGQTYSVQEVDIETIERISNIHQQ